MKDINRAHGGVAHVKNLLVGQRTGIYDLAGFHFFVSFVSQAETTTKHCFTYQTEDPKEWESGSGYSCLGTTGKNQNTSLPKFSLSS